VNGFYVRHSQTQSVNSGVEKSMTASCRAGDVAIGGGFSKHYLVEVVESRPADLDPDAVQTGWLATFHNASDSDGLGASVWVSCADLPEPPP
jgi:hypothetical protein